MPNKKVAVSDIRKTSQSLVSNDLDLAEVTNPHLSSVSQSGYQLARLQLVFCLAELSAIGAGKACHSQNFVEASAFGRGSLEREWAQSGIKSTS
jgi:hypothetical protein